MHIRVPLSRAMHPPKTDLAKCYTGEKIPKAFIAAADWFQKAAAQADATAENNLGLMYQNGNGIPKSYEQAVAWFTKAAQTGLVSAQFNLATLYQNGDGVLRDPA